MAHDTPNREILEGEIIAAPLDKVAAANLTARIRTATDELWRLLGEAFERRAWEALGYRSWSAYVRGEFTIDRGYSYQLLDKAFVVRALDAAAAEARGKAKNARKPLGDNSKLSARADTSAGAVTTKNARSVRRNLPAVADTVRDLAAAGETTETAARTAIAALPAMPRNRQPAVADEDRARRAAEYAAKTARRQPPPAAFSHEEPAPKPAPTERPLTPGAVFGRIGAVKWEPEPAGGPDQQSWHTVLNGERWHVTVRRGGKA